MTAFPEFEVIDERFISEINTLAKLYLHKPTGAQVLSLENDDENKVFGITFRTPPSDSTGLAHIMEHSVLCGSQKYPLKKPFVELVRGSLNTFLNAMTFPDKTCYPVASQNTQDFYNLVDVYMDAVLHPLIQPHVLDQEGWHYELSDPDGEMSYKGVVFNEMKGAYSSPDSLLSEKSQQLLFPGHTYGEDSGGNPEEIPNLTYAQFKSFHETYYHPSNARIYFYGDDDPDERLRRIGEYLRGFERIEVDSAVPLHTGSPEYERVRYGYEVDDGNEQPKAYVSVNWRLAQATDVQLSLALSILSHILVGMSASPLRKALIDSGLGEGLVGRGVDGGLRQMIFSTGLKGVQLENVNAVEGLILETLYDLSSNGIEKDTIAASMNTIEFRLRENNTGSYPRGLLMMFRALNTWLYDGDPIAPLAFEKPLNAIKVRLESGDRYFEGLIKEYLIENPNRSVVILEPDPDLRRRRQADEKSRLERARREMSPEQILAVVENTRQLNLHQETPDPPEILKTLPSLSLEDLDRMSKIIPNEIGEIAKTRLYYHDLFTNGITYLDIGFDLIRLPEMLLSYIPLFGRALIEMGTQSEDYVRLVQRIGRTTGGLYTTRYTSHVRDRQESTAWLFLRGKGTMDQVPDLLAILKDILLTTEFDNPERFLQIVLEEKAAQEARLIPGGHAVVNTRMRARYDQAGWMAERMGGIEYLFFLRELESKIKQEWAAVLEDLQAIRNLLVNRPGMIVNATLDGEDWEGLQPRLSEFLTQLPGEVVPQVSWKAPALPSPEGLTIPSQVNYVAKGADLFRTGYSLDGSALVVKNFLRTSWLWDSIRVRGGAYGAFSVLDQRSGVWTFLSYRDPNLHETLNNFDLSVKFLRELELSQEELVKSIIGVIGDLDAYLLPDAKGYTAMLRHLAGDSDEFRQELRNQVLETKASDFRLFAEVLDAALKDADVVVLGSQSALETAGNINGHAFQIQKVL